jgi:hypothetical protein
MFVVNSGVFSGDVVVGVFVLDEIIGDGSQTPMTVAMMGK